MNCCKNAQINNNKFYSPPIIWSRRWLLAVVVVSVLLLYIFHRPLPEGFTKKPMDRFLIHFFETSLRLTYYWPTRLFTKPSAMVWWTRAVLNSLSLLLGPYLPDNVILAKNRNFGGVPVRVYSPRENMSTDGAVVFIHGGGFALGNVDIYDSLTRRVSKMLNVVLISIDYRLSPETPFPGGLNDCEMALEYFLKISEEEYGVDPKKIVLMGDSAGGNLVAAITQRRRDTGKKPDILGQVLIYPLLQLADLQSLSYRYFHTNLHGTSLVDPESVAYYYMFYAGINMDRYGHLVKYVLVNGHIAHHLRDKVERILDYDSFSYLNYRNETLIERKERIYSVEAQQLLAPFLTNPSFSPLMQEDLSDLPPAFVMTCEYDVLRDEGIMYANRLKAAGVKTEARNYVNGFHAMLNFHNEIEEASDSLNDIVSWTKNTFLSMKN